MIPQINKSSLLVFCLLLSLVPKNYAQLQFEHRSSFSRDELIDESFSWIAKDDNRNDIHVYKLSCPTCIKELQTAFEKDPQNVGLINLSTFKKSDRLLAQCLVATALSHPDETKRSETFGELLHIFAFSAEQFHKNPKQWRSLCFNFWNYDDYEINDHRPWADALNWLDRQNHINVLLGKTRFPGTIQLEDQNLIPTIQEQTYEDQYAFVALSLPWLKYPEAHPVPGTPESQNHPEMLPLVVINPLKQLPPLEWTKHARTARSGAFWQFVGDPDVTLHPRMLEFSAAFLDLPTDLERQNAFADAIEALAGNAKSSPKSILAALPRTKGLPKVAEERKDKRVAEARKMVEGFLAYDHARKPTGKN